jgi:purine-binding chemotaxis protein CheW
MSNDLNVNQDMTILGSITAQKFISELTESITIFESGSTRFGDTIDDRHSLTGSLNLTGSFNINNYSITEVSNDTTLADGSSTAVLTENALKTYLSTETEDFQTYLRKSFAHTGSFINSSTQSFSAVTASAPSGFSSTSKEDFMFFNNGAFMETDAISIKQSGSLMFLFVNTDSIGYDVDSNDEVLQWVTFQLEQETYGINVMQVQEVLRYSEIAPVPGAPNYVLGIINLRGNVVTVIDTRLRFGLQPTEVTDNSRIVIIESEQQVIGILVDSVAEVVYLKTSEIDSAPNVGTDESARFIQGVSNRDGELLILVDLDKMLTDEEWDEISRLG